MCISLLGLLDKKKSRRNLPFAFAVNLVKNLVHFFHAPSASYSVGRAFQNKILRFFFLSKWSKFLYWRFSLFSFVNFDRDLARPYGNIRESTTCKTCLTRTSFKGLSVELAKCPFLFYENQNWKRLAHKTECMKFLQSFFGTHALHAPVKDGCAYFTITITRSKMQTSAYIHQICSFKVSF